MTVVGSSNAFPTEAFRWTSAGGMQPLGDLPGGGTYSYSAGVNGDGSVVVGHATSAFGTEAFRWTATTTASRGTSASTARSSSAAALPPSVPKRSSGTRPKACAT